MHARHRPTVSVFFLLVKVSLPLKEAQVHSRSNLFHNAAAKTVETQATVQVSLCSREKYITNKIGTKEDSLSVTNKTLEA